MFYLINKSCRGTGIRTQDALSRIQHFECCTIDHSDIPLKMAEEVGAAPKRRSAQRFSRPCPPLGGFILQCLLICSRRDLNPHALLGNVTSTPCLPIPPLGGTQDRRMLNASILSHASYCPLREHGRVTYALVCDLHRATTA